MTLTEKWKKGELKFGAYYVNRLEEHRIWLYNDRSKTPESQHEIYEILAPVPSYEEWQSLNQILDSMQDTNKVLAHRLNLCKDLLLECRYKIIADLDNARLCESSVDIEDFEYLLNRITNAIGEK